MKKGKRGCNDFNHEKEIVEEREAIGVEPYLIGLDINSSYTWNEGGPSQSHDIMPN